MILLIDGYNLIKQVLGTKYVAPADKFKFLSRLNTYAKKRKLNLHIVFDGYDDDDNFSSKHLKVSYSGHRESADQFIKNLAGSLPGNALLISSDRELCNFVEEDSKLEYMDSLEFYSFLRNSESENGSAPTDGQVIKMSEGQDDELDQLMAQDFGLEMKLEDIVTDDCGPQRHKPSKDEKRILKKIKKL